jgi:membrane-associated protein
MENSNDWMALVYQFVDIILHLDRYLNEWILLFGPWIYVILFAIIFAETGLIVFPFLPGDSLLFALGALTTGENAALNLPILCVTLIVAAIIGDAVNYSIGKHVGMRLFSNPNSKIFRREHLERTQKFYDKHGGKTIVIARFVPIIRTFAPFVAGMAGMRYSSFATYNIVGALTWVLSITIAGHIFGNLPIVKQNFHIVVVAIIVVSVIPIAVEWWKMRKEKLANS